MIHTNALEKAISAGTSYKDCFTGVDLRRTEIACVVWLIQVTCGTWYVSATLQSSKMSLLIVVGFRFGGNVIYFLQQAGFTPLQSFNFGIAKNCVGIFGTFCAWWVMEYVGRRKLYLWGLAVMTTILL